MKSFSKSAASSVAALLALSSVTQAAAPTLAGERCRTLYASELTRFESRAIDAANQLERLAVERKKAVKKAELPATIATATGGALIGASTLKDGDSAVWNVGVPTLFFGIMGPAAGELFANKRFNRKHQSEIRQLNALIERRNSIKQVLELLDHAENLPSYAKQLEVTLANPELLTFEERAAEHRQRERLSQKLYDAREAFLKRYTIQNPESLKIIDECVNGGACDESHFDALHALAAKRARNLMLLDESGRICQDNRLLNPQDILALVDNMY